MVGGTQDELISALHSYEVWREVLRIVRSAPRVELRTVFPIDRTKPFDPGLFPEIGLGNDWSVWRGRAKGKGLSGEEDRDPRSSTLQAIDFSRLLLTSVVRYPTEEMDGETFLARLRDTKHIPLDAEAFAVIWQHRNECAPMFRAIGRLTGTLFFPGTVLRDPDGDRCILSLAITSNGSLIPGHDWLDCVYGADEHGLLIET